MGFAAMAGTPAQASESHEVYAKATSHVAVVPQYVYSYNLAGLRQAVLTAETQGFTPIGGPQFRFVPELGGPGWVQFIVPAGY
jgi:hypothetical protein